MRYLSLVFVVVFAVLAVFLGEQYYPIRQTSAETTSDQVKRTWRVHAEPPLLISALSLTTGPAGDTHTMQLNILLRLAFAPGGAPKVVRVDAVPVSTVGPLEHVRTVGRGGYLALSYDLPVTVKDATIVISKCADCTP
jgi:hypothetical protein